jgi:GcrA cell cycle regulator
MTWTAERIELLQTLWLDGKSAAEISRALGEGVSRNAVMGKVSRLGFTDQSRALPALAPRRQEAISLPRPRPAIPKPPSVAVCTPAAPVVEAETTLTQKIQEPIETVVVPFSKRVTLEELEANMCRWPMEHPLSADICYCGAQKLDKVSYCAPHQRVAYRLEDGRRRERGGRLRLPTAPARAISNAFRPVAAHNAEREWALPTRAGWTTPAVVLADRIEIASATAG